MFGSWLKVCRSIVAINIILLIIWKLRFNVLVLKGLLWLLYCLHESTRLWLRLFVLLRTFKKLANWPSHSRWVPKFNSSCLDVISLFILIFKMIIEISIDLFRLISSAYCAIKIIFKSLKCNNNYRKIVQWPIPSCFLNNFISNKTAHLV